MALALAAAESIRSIKLRARARRFITYTRVIEILINGKYNIIIVCLITPVVAHISVFAYCVLRHGQIKPCVLFACRTTHTSRPSPINYARACAAPIHTHAHTHALTRADRRLTSSLAHTYTLCPNLAHRTRARERAHHVVYYKIILYAHTCAAHSLQSITTAARSDRPSRVGSPINGPDVYLAGLSANSGARASRSCGGTVPGNALCGENAISATRRRTAFIFGNMQNARLFFAVCVFVRVHIKMDEQHTIQFMRSTRFSISTPPPPTPTTSAIQRNPKK